MRERTLRSKNEGRGGVNGGKSGVGKTAAVTHGAKPFSIEPAPH
jgi:hypothetical protein